ncbi:acyl-CoA thioesterase [Thermosulfurimonas dismutans]|uniref:4-hydroxybenzoyl-CoA thioesterase family active site n=1 Tax=Thermosulfurimonas dismutans TaxID=999894 RepID=A0A179D6V0_9BACT|nr:thioesterase family protein [Thermosulfurimonas dismutans]OAQ21815.1 4-hydroxybenzoyl-CoA thioesterase family active site [Thermosulfurimonas dismutans]
MEVKYRVIYGDTDTGGVMYYGNYLRLFEIGRTELLRVQGITYREIEEGEGLILPVVEAHVRYKAPARYDDLLTIRTVLSEVKPHRIRFNYEIRREEKLLVQGYTVHVPVTREGRLTRFSQTLYQKLLSICRESVRK